MSGREIRKKAERKNKEESSKKIQKKEDEDLKERSKEKKKNSEYFTCMPRKRIAYLVGEGEDEESGQSEPRGQWEWANHGLQISRQRESEGNI